MRKFKLCGIQLSSESVKSEKNIEKALKFLERAVSSYDPDIIIFPETVTTGFNPGLSAKELWNHIDRIPGRLTYKICKAARDYKRYIIWPTYERGYKRGIIYNSAVLINRKGQIAGIYRKTHLYPTERKSQGGWSTAGHQFPVFKTPFAKIGMLICFDGDFPEGAIRLAEKGAEVLIRPSAFLRSYEIWKLTNSARAYDNHVFVAGINACGIDASGTGYFGNSLIISPTTQVLAHARAGQEIICAELDPEHISLATYGSKDKRDFDHLKDRNIKALRLKK